MKKMKTTDEVLEELNAICTGWELVWNSNDMETNYKPIENTVYVFVNPINEFYSITIDCRPYKNQYMATHNGVKYNDDRSECGGYADSAEHAYIQLQFAMRKRAKNILTMVNEMTDKRKK